MKLIIEAGGTKTAWVVADAQNVSSYIGKGFNAIYDDGFEVPPSLKSYGQSIRQVFFYGAGVLTGERCKAVADLIRLHFQKAEIEVATDIMAACRGMLGVESGWVGMLGTGAALAEFNGKTYQTPIPSLGFLLGDEGSGAFMGRIILRDFYRRQLPMTIHKKLEADHGHRNLLQEAYGRDITGRFFGQFSRYLRDPAECEYSDRLVTFALKSYCQTFVEGQSIDSIFFVGSIATVFRGHLERQAAEYGIQVRDIQNSPLDGLIAFHA